MGRPGDHDVPVVLIVDDEKPNVSAFLRAFRRDFNIRTASSAEEALRALESGPVDVVVTDFTMPETTGTELLEVVATRWPDVGRVILSGHSDLDEIRSALETGTANAFLGKPWDRATVLHVVGDVLSPAPRGASAA